MAMCKAKIFTFDKSLLMLYNENMRIMNSDVAPLRVRDYTKEESYA